MFIDEMEFHENKAASEIFFRLAKNLVFHFHSLLLAARNARITRKSFNENYRRFNVYFSHQLVFASQKGELFSRCWFACRRKFLLLSKVLVFIFDIHLCLNAFGIFAELLRQSREMEKSVEQSVANQFFDLGWWKTVLASKKALTVADIVFCRFVD